LKKSENPNVVYVGNDSAPSQAFDRLDGILPGTSFLGRGGKNMFDRDELFLAVRKADFVLIGMSNPPENTAMEVDAAGMAVQAGIPFGFYADTFGAYNRASFEPVREQASLVLVIAPGRDVERAEEAFPSARVICTYNPLWPDYFLPASREESRKLIGAADNEFVILASGENYVTMVPFTCEVIEAASEIVQPDFPVRVVIAPHPGEKRITPEMYEQILSFNEELGVNAMMIPQGVKTDQVIPGTNVIVQRFNSSGGIHGICRRIPVIDLYRPMARALQKRISGDDTGYFIDTGAVAHVYPEDVDHTDYGALGEALYNVKHNGTFLAEMARAQETAIPYLEPGAPTANMKQAILDLLAGK
jgi:hypothetical protein